MSSLVRVRSLTKLNEWHREKVPGKLLWRWDFNDPGKTRDLLGQAVEQKWQDNFYAEAHFARPGFVRLCLFREGRPRGVFVKAWLEAIASPRKATIEEGKVWILKIIAHLNATVA